MIQRLGRRSLWGLTLVPMVILAWVVTLPAADEAPLNLEQTIVLKGRSGKLDHLTLDSKGERLFLCNKVNNTVDVVDLKAGKLLKQLPDQAGAQGVAYAADVDRLFVALGEGGYCNVFDGTSYELVQSVKFKDDADNVRYNAKTSRVYVAHADTALGVIDAKTYKVITDIKLSGSAEAFELEKGRPLMYVDVPPEIVAVIDTDKNEVVKEYKLQAATKNNALALDEDNHRLFVGCLKEPMMVVLDSETGKEVATAPLAGEVDDMIFDAKRKLIYASCGEGFLVVLKQQDADHYQQVAKIETAKLARTMCYNAETGRLYLGVPRQEGKPGPEIRVFQAR